MKTGAFIGDYKRETTPLIVRDPLRAGVLTVESAAKILDYKKGHVRKKYF